MAKLTIAEYAAECGVSKQAIYDRKHIPLTIRGSNIGQYTIDFEIEERHGIPTFVIDTDVFPVERFLVRQRGRKRIRKDTPS